MTGLCPNCGYDLTPDEPMVRGELFMRPYGNCWWHGREIHLAPNEAGVLWALLKADGGLVTRAALAERIGYDGDSNVVDVYLSRLRKKLSAVAPCPIENIHSRGVRLR